jgi:hypothetical protein
MTNTTRCQTWVANHKNDIDSKGSYEHRKAKSEKRKTKAQYDTHTNKQYKLPKKLLQKQFHVLMKRIVFRYFTSLVVFNILLSKFISHCISLCARVFLFLFFCCKCTAGQVVFCHFGWQFFATFDVHHECPELSLGERWFLLLAVGDHKNVSLVLWSWSACAWFYVRLLQDHCTWLKLCLAEITLVRAICGQ